MKYNVIVWDVNRKEFVPYDIFPYLKREFIRSKETPYTFEEYKTWIKKEAMCQWWARCEYEVILSNWPCEDKKEKIDVYYQILNNLDTITTLFMEEMKDFTVVKTDKLDELYIPVMWPNVQELMDYEDFHDNAYLINDDNGYADFGDSAYFVNFKWLREHGCD